MSAGGKKLGYTPKNNPAPFKKDVRVTKPCHKDSATSNKAAKPEGTGEKSQKTGGGRNTQHSALKEKRVNQYILCFPLRYLIDAGPDSRAVDRGAKGQGCHPEPRGGKRLRAPPVRQGQPSDGWAFDATPS